MLAPPRENSAAQAGSLAETTAIDLAAPINPDLGDVGPALHLRVDPVIPGANALEVFQTAPSTPPAPPVRIPFAPDTSVALSFSSLNHVVPAHAALASPDGAGGFRIDGLNLSLDGWWKVEVVVRSAQTAEIRRSFMLLLGDPNIYGADAVRLPETDPSAQRLFDQGLASIRGLSSIRYTQRLSDGAGNVVLIDFAATEGRDGQPPARSQSTARVGLVTIGDREWIRRSDGQWSERNAGSVPSSPSVAAETYIGATAIAMGPTETVAGEEAQIVTFYVPATPSQSEAWFVWWVGVESGHVLREAMVARAHYMLTDFRDMNEPVAIVPPVQESLATPATTPVATPGTSGHDDATASP